MNTGNSCRLTRLCEYLRIAIATPLGIGIVALFAVGTLDTFGTAVVA